MGIGDYLPIYDSGRKKLRDEGSKDGKSRAESDYPTYIFRDKQQVEQQAAERFSEEFNYPEKFLHELQKMTDSMWKDYHKNLGLSREKTWKEVKTDTIDKAQRAVNIWKSHISEARHQYVIAYVVAYFEYIEKEDARRAPPPPKPTSQPATPKPEHYTYNT